MSTFQQQIQSLWKGKPKGLGFDDFLNVTVNICGFPSFFSQPLLEKLDHSKSGFVNMNDFIRFVLTCLFFLEKNYPRQFLGEQSEKSGPLHETVPIVERPVSRLRGPSGLEAVHARQLLLLLFSAFVFNISSTSAADESPRSRIFESDTRVPGEIR